jgi:Ser/Thr protein kinase RdoA (MazF antagonist)
MYNTIPRHAVYIDDLKDFIRRKYRLEPLTITPAKRGYYGETYRMDTADNSYFLKLDYSIRHQLLYENSFHIIQHLHRHGINFISNIVKTADRALYTRFDAAVLGMFEWIEGENVQNENTKIPEYQMLAKVYTIPSEDISHTAFSLT